jgi:hypothetical protein
LVELPRIHTPVAAMQHPVPISLVENLWQNCTRIELAFRLRGDGYENMAGKSVLYVIEQSGGRGRAILTPDVNL